MARINTIIRISVTLGIILQSIVSMHADDFSEAAKAYNAGKYEYALNLYEGLEKQHGTSSELLFNKGQAYTRAGDIGRAMVCYQRALRLDPSNGEARHNAAYLSEKVADANKAELKDKNVSVVPDVPSFFIALKNYITRRHLSDTWALWGGITFVLFCVCVSLYVFRSEVILRKAGFFGGAVMLGLCIIFMVFAFMGASAADRHDEGVIVDYKTELHAEPSTSAKSVATPLTRGTVMTVIDKESAEDGKTLWYKVRLNGYFAGWVPADVFEVI